MRTFDGEPLHPAIFDSGDELIAGATSPPGRSRVLCLVLMRKWLEAAIQITPRVFRASRAAAAPSEAERLDPAQ
jgi:hypothetical protein